MPKTKDIPTDEPNGHPVIETAPVTVSREEWDALVNRVRALEETVDRFIRQYKAINHNVQEINYRFSEWMAQQSAGR